MSVLIGYIHQYIQCRCSTPTTADHAEYYDGHKHEYNYGFGVAVDCDGLARVWSGHCPGSFNDITIYYGSDLAANPGLYFARGDKMLADGIFAHVEEHRFITPICYVYRDLNEMENRYNDIHSWDRAIVENYFNRVKYGCPVVKDIRFAKDRVNLIFLSCLIQTNIRIKYQSPLRS